MKKLLFAAFAGLCVVSSLMVTSNSGQLVNNPGFAVVYRDSVPKKPDSLNLKSDTSSRRLVDLTMR